jgi:hypothetical protein
MTHDDLLGTWKPLSVRNTRPDGSTVFPFGTSPGGILMFQGDRRFAFILNRTDLPRFVAGDRFSGTAEENRAIVQGSFAYFGTFELAGEVVTMRVEGGTWPAWTGTTLQRHIVSFDGREMRWMDFTPSIGGAIENAWLRIEPESA